MKNTLKVLLASLLLATSAAASAAPRGEVLVLLSSETTLPLKAGKTMTSGYYLNELGVPAAALLDYGFGGWQAAPLPAPEVQPLQLKVKGSAEDSVPLDYAALPETILIEKGTASALRAELTLPEALEAPVEKGRTVGKVSIFQDDTLLNEYEVKAAADAPLLTFGGAYSNHIAAAAYAAHACGFASTGIIRGEELAARPLNPTLQTAQKFGMQLRFISREQYRQKHTAEFLAQLRADYPEHYVIPEGGTNALAVQGCREILTENDLNNFDLICCAAGTGGTIAGLIEASRPQQRILGFSALKGLFLNDEVAKLTAKTNWEIIDDYCCGGYAKTTPELLQFIRLFEAEHSLPLEQIYTDRKSVV